MTFQRSSRAFLNDAARGNQLLVETEAVARNNGQAGMSQNSRSAQSGRAGLCEQ